MPGAAIERLRAETRPALPQSLAPGIGIIGAGGIAHHGHLPAYQKYRFNVVGIASRRVASATKLATAWSIPRVFGSWQELVAADEVSVVDVTYPFDDERLEIVEAAARAGKHILMQKPLAHTYDAACRMVAIAERYGVRLAVNQNARWCPQYRAAALAIAHGWLGTPYYALHSMANTQADQPWFQAAWYAQQPRFQLLEYTVHHLDLMRFWLGREPLAVKALVGRRPGQQAAGEMLASVLISFGPECMGLVTENNAAVVGKVQSQFRIDGTAGVIAGTVMNEPSLTVQSRQLGGEPQTMSFDTAWFPDGFAGTMGELMCAIEEAREPSISASDNLKSMKVVFDAYDDAAGTPVR